MTANDKATNLKCYRRTAYMCRALFPATLLFLTACGGDEDAARIVVGNSNTVSELNSLQYQSPYVVQVTDTNGRAAPNTSVDVNVRNTFYKKGQYQTTGSGWQAVIAIECTAEDLNNNGVLDAGEDINGNGVLDPTNAATIAAHPSLEPTITVGSNTIITDDSGFGYFSLVYPKSEANWTVLEISVTAKVSGSERISVIEEILPVLDVDISDEATPPPGGVESSYGVANNCSDAN
ncbi:hypothetical protein MNBD_GAMMA09-1951 [hydrothermal vent metagenome]|uniref:Lipoprotein n=1 Tax=hydrothermal vent metagenome TaxID=652676 RepID=A0A3B0YJC8_9ZZZZ